MSDPTEIVIIASFCSALGVFATAATVRQLLKNPVATEIPIALLPEDNLSPYAAPVSSTEPPELLPGKVPTRFYIPLDLLGLGFVFVLFFGLVVTSVRSAGEAETVLDPSKLIASIAFQFINAGIVTALVISRVRPVEWLGLKWEKWPWVFLIAPGGVICMWIFFRGLEFSGFMKWMESFGVAPVQDSVKLLRETTDPLTLCLMAVAAVVAAPICEEIVFRGYLYPVAKKFAGPWIACICSALVFAAAHGSMAALLPLLIFGCLLVFVYEKTGSIWAPMAMHFCFNGATVIVQVAARFHDIPLDAKL